MTNTPPPSFVRTSEIGRLIQIQSAVRVFALLSNLAALAFCLFLLGDFRTRTLDPSSLFTSLFFISAFLILSGTLWMVWGWVERRRLAVESRSVSDERTGALTVQAFKKILDEELRRAGRYHYALTLCRVELDDFESLHENFGPEKAGSLFRQFSDLLRSTVRFSDTVGHAKKDGFLVLLPHTDLLRAQKFLTRVLIETEERLDATFSAGLTCYQAGEKQADLLDRLDAAIGSAKREGKKNIRALVPGQDAHAVLSF